MQAIQLTDTITKLGPEAPGTVVVAGSHGGRYCGYLTAKGGLRGVILNDAGVGKDNAGVGSLEYLQPLGVPAATVANSSARIGDAADMLARGVISHCNDVAAALGCSAGQRCGDAAEAMRGGEPFQGDAPPYQEARMLFRDEPVRVIGVDSASLIEPDDAGAIIVTGSHGAMLAGSPGYGISVAAHGAVFNDAGVGVDEAGIQRLRVLDEAGVPAVTVETNSARIGDARSAWESGIISHVNRLAAERRVTAGMTVPAFADALSG